MTDERMTDEPMTDDAEQLSGGNMNDVVRIGDTVHRSAGPWTPTIHRLLDHLARKDVPGFPRVLGFDDAGREVLTYLPGVVPSYPLPDWVWDDAVLVDGTLRLLAMHDATASFEQHPDDVWQVPAHEPAEVVCHNDFAPYNLVFDTSTGGSLAPTPTLTGVIDCDVASPGPRVWDVAYWAYRIVPLTHPDNTDTPGFDLAARRRRLALLCATYGRGLSGVDVVATAVQRLHDIAAFTDSRVAENPDLATHAQMYRADAAWLSANPASVTL